MPRVKSQRKKKKERAKAAAEKKWERQEKAKASDKVSNIQDYIFLSF